MSDWYKATNERIGKRLAIKHRYTKELCLAGRYGLIWPWNDEQTQFIGVINSARVACREFPELRARMIAGDEHRFSFARDKLDYWVKVLRITKNRNSMIELADGFSKRSYE